MKLLAGNYFFPHASEFVKDYIRTCGLCQRSKAVCHKPFGKLQPLPVPLRPWCSISMDHITDFALSQGHDCLLVIVCRLTKMAHFIPCLTTDTAADLAKQFIRNVHRLHGLPDDIVCERGTTFASIFFWEITAALKDPIEHVHSLSTTDRRVD